MVTYINGQLSVTDDEGNIQIIYPLTTSEMVHIKSDNETDDITLSEFINQLIDTIGKMNIKINDLEKEIKNIKDKGNT